MRRIGLAAGMAVLSMTGAFAQTLPPGAFVLPRPEQDPAQRLLQDQRNRERQQEADQAPAQIALPQAPAMPDIPKDADVDSLADVEPMFVIREVEFTGDKVLPSSDMQAIVAPFLGHKLGRNRVNLLLRRLTETFIERGYITTRAYLGPQNLASGVMKVNIIAGRVGGYTLNGTQLRPLAADAHPFQTEGGGVLTDAGTAWAFGSGVGNVLRLPDLEQGVDQINRLRRNQAEIQILPGQSPGDSVIAIANRPGDRFFYDVGMDNYGSTQTGKQRYRVSAEADNVIGLQESIGLNYVGTRDSNAVVFSTAVPVGYQTFSYTTSVSEYQQLIGDVALLQGRSFSQILGWNSVLGRSRAGRYSFDLTFTKTRSERSVNGLDLSPQSLSVLRAALNGFTRFTASGQPATVTYEVGYSRGVPWLDADHDAAGITGSDAHSQFNKVDATSTVQMTLGSVGPTSWAYRGTIHGQLSHVALFGTQQIFLGGMSSVRGFAEGGIAGDSGVYVRNELALQNAPVWHDARIEPYLFLDGGKAHLVAQGGWPTLAGTGIGARLQWKFRSQLITSELLVGQALIQPASLGKKATVLLATLNWSI
ncbi:ShlB/FhaC/HecB family hemolysin secretion/activation protein [Ralstonia mojiangensis]|uniref:ShlB/FhaC/HecB family hemolysin secretion/activation protein n=1 Tax=Ralstonia mojiangensis TaxID=2953895 RepID=UPI0021B3D8A6|nr:ShlB/FhaC/HecB family hemolysin secretion/activation protein [Ralstonia mojiangensis]MCT7325477.1 ShlB/FhaC/HecB family hemolysin secretion/activation protein [Ralstonia mojiangensis]